MLLYQLLSISFLSGGWVSLQCHELTGFEVTGANDVGSIHTPHVCLHGYFLLWTSTCGLKRNKLISISWVIFIENVFKEFLLCTYSLVAICSVAFLIDISIHLFSRAFCSSFSNLGLFRALINQQNCSPTVEESLHIHTSSNFPPCNNCSPAGPLFTHDSHQSTPLSSFIMAVIAARITVHLYINHLSCFHFTCQLIIWISS